MFGQSAPGGFGSGLLIPRHECLVGWIYRDTTTREIPPKPRPFNDMFPPRW